MGDVGRIATAVGTGGMSEAANAASGGGLYGGGGGKGNSGPAAPDFQRMAEMQANSGRINQQNPFGSTGWTVGPDGRMTQSTTLAPGLQQGVAGLEGQIGHQGPLGTGDQARDQAINATYNQYASRLDPQWAQRGESERQMLANQGIDPGTQAYTNEMGNFNRAQNDAYQSAANNAVTQGLQAQQTTFGQNLASQMAPYQQIGALQGLTGGLTGQGQQTQFLPAAMAQYGGNLQQYGINQAGKNSMMNGAAGLGAAGLMAL